MILFDTPGIIEHKRNKLEERMMQAVIGSIRSAEAIVAVRRQQPRCLIVECCPFGVAEAVCHWLSCDQFFTADCHRLSSFD